MVDPFVPRVGGVLSADIAVPEHERVVRFYSRVLGTGEHPLWRADLMNNRGTPIIGVGPRSAELAHLPLQWMPHIQVGDVSASVDRALSLGGKELMHAKDDGGKSQWAVLLDPNEAAFGMIPIVSAEDIPPTDEASALDPGAPVGRIAWLDLTVPDVSATRDFYEQVVGWSSRQVDQEDADGRYSDSELIGADGRPAAGLCQARGASDDLPPIWLLHLPVGELGESLRRVHDEGGQVIQVAGANEGEPGRAVVRDPVGAYVALVPG